MPTAAHTLASRLASSMAALDVATSVPIVTIRVTPASRARVRTSGRSLVNSGK